MFIELEHVSKIFGQEHQPVSAVNDISFTINKGSYTLIQGPSGSGKTTLLTLIAGLQNPSNGRIIVDGISLYEDLNSEGRARFRSEYIGFVFQSFNLVPYLTAMENVMLPIAHQDYTKKIKRDLAAKALEAVGLSDRINHLPNQLSGGQQQRTAIARAIVNEPLIIFADEPTGNLDQKTKTEVMELFDQLHEKNMTIIMVSHETGKPRTRQEVLRIIDGKIVQNIPVLT